MSRFVCSETGITQQNLEELAMAEGSKGIFHDPEHVMDELAVPFVRNMRRDHGDKYGTTYQAIASSLLDHIAKHDECRKQYEGIVREQKQSEKEAMEALDTIKVSEADLKKFDYLKEDFINALRRAGAHKKATEQGLRKVQIGLPDLGAEYAGFAYDAEKDVCTVRIKRRPGYFGQMYRTLEVYLPIKASTKIVKENVR